MSLVRIQPIPQLVDMITKCDTTASQWAWVETVTMPSPLLLRLNVRCVVGRPTCLHGIVTPNRQGERQHHSRMGGSSPSLDSGLSCRFESDLSQTIINGTCQDIDKHNAI